MWRPEGSSDPLEQELQVTVTSLIEVLRPELGSSQEQEHA